MKLLIVHRAFPGQFQHLIKPLKKRGDHIVALGEQRLIKAGLSSVVDQLIGYTLTRGNTPQIPDGLLDLESKMIRAEAAANAIEPLVKKGYKPDLIISHSGWGESMFLSHLLPRVPQLHLLEYFYGADDGDMVFEDPFVEDGFSATPNWKTLALAQVKSLSLLASFESMSWGLSPTKFQCSQFPKRIQQRCSVIHDGINTKVVNSNSRVELTLPNGMTLKYGDPVITLVNRTFEPYRGIHVFLRALIDVQRLNPNVQTILVGQDTPQVSYGAWRKDGKGWLSSLKDELGDRLDWKRIHVLGTVSYFKLIQVMQLSSAHVYFTYPFVLSWSMLEAMSCECLLVGSRTEPVQEVIRHGDNGLLVDFRDVEGLSKKLLDILENPSKYIHIRKSARKTVEKNYELQACIRDRLKLIDKLTASNSLKHRID